MRDQSENYSLAVSTTTLDNWQQGRSGLDLENIAKAIDKDSSPIIVPLQEISTLLRQRSRQDIDATLHQCFVSYVKSKSILTLPPMLVLHHLIIGSDTRIFADL